MKIGGINFAYMLFVTPIGKGYGCFAIKKTSEYKYRISASFYSPQYKSCANKKILKQQAISLLNNNQYIDVCVDYDIDPTTSFLIKMAFQLKLPTPNWVNKAYDSEAFFFGLKEDNKQWISLVKNCDVSLQYLEDLLSNNKNYNQILKIFNEFNI